MRALLRLSTGFFLAACLAARTASADDAATLEAGINSYETENYPQCIERFRAMLTPGSTTALREGALKQRARMYYAACLIAQKRDQDADEQMRQLILDDPRFYPDRAAFPGKVLDRFADARGKMKEEIDRLERERIAAEEAERKRRDEERAREAARIALLERMAKEEFRVRRNSRWLAAIPLGVGQFQNEQRALGWTFLGAGVVFAGISAATYFAKESIEANYVSGTSDVDQTRKQRDQLVFYNRLSFGAFAATAIGGILHAQLTFVPEITEIRERKIPEPTITPVVSGARDGGTIGVAGRF